MRTWQLQEAKARFSELVREAEGGQAQLVSEHGVPRVVVVDVATYERLTAPGRSLVDALVAAPHRCVRSETRASAALVGGSGAVSACFLRGWTGTPATS